MTGSRTTSHSQRRFTFFFPLQRHIGPSYIHTMDTTPRHPFFGHSRHYLVGTCSTELVFWLRLSVSRSYVSPFSTYGACRVWGVGGGAVTRRWDGLWPLRIPSQPCCGVPCKRQTVYFTCIGAIESGGGRSVEDAFRSAAL